jgi:hypothetical protein
MCITALVVDAPASQLLYQNANAVALPGCKIVPWVPEALKKTLARLRVARLGGGTSALIANIMGNLQGGIGITKPIARSESLRGCIFKEIARGVDVLGSGKSLDCLLDVAS